jgi:hypothetical protein
LRGLGNSLFTKLITRINGKMIFFGLLAVGAFWFAIQLCWSVVGKQWYSVAFRLICAVALFGLGIVMIFFTAFGTN